MGLFVAEDMLFSQQVNGQHGLVPDKEQHSRTCNVLSMLWGSEIGRTSHGGQLGELF